jgi:outer membrane receptor protein involved in Fe transport
MKPVLLITKLLLAVVIAGLLLQPLAAQVDTGIISGTVRDSSGAAIPEAPVIITETQTNNHFEVATDQAGNYVSPPLRVGIYSVNISAPGFKTYMRQGVTLQVQERLRIEATLEIGTRTEQVVVTGEVAAVQTETSSLGQVITGQQTTELPLNGRDYTQLASLTAGVINTNNGTNGNTNGGFSSNGTRDTLNNYMLDGIDNNSDDNGLAVIPVNVDAIAEFKIQTNAYDAEFGRSGGGAMNAVLKSGTNEVHGTFFEFFRNSYLDAQNYFSVGKKLSTKYNYPGVTFGAPIIKNKLFFFGDYQLTDTRIPTVQRSSVPTDGQANGDFSAPGNKIIYDPASYNAATNTRTPFTNNKIPTTSMSSIGKSFALLYPAPNVPGATKNNYIQEPTNQNRIDQGDGRLDYRMTENDQLFGRYSQMGQTQYRPFPLPGLAGGGSSSSGNNFDYRKGGVLGYTHIFTPTTLNEFRAGFNWSYSHRGIPNGGFQLPPSNLAIPGVPNDPAINGTSHMGLSGYTRLGLGEFAPTSLSPQERELRDTLNLVRGRHTIRVGAEYRWTQFNLFQLTSPRGTFNFTGLYTGKPGATGNALADMEVGIPTTSYIDSLVYLGNRQRVPSLFAQDDFKVTQNFTLNLGVRYEYFSPLSDVHNHQANFNYATGKLMVAGQNGNSSALVTAQKANFGPRIGFAYTPIANTVIRGAFGLFYSGQEIRTGDPLQLAYNLPFYYQPTFVGDGITPVRTLEQGFPPLDPSQAINPGVTSVDTDVKTPYYEQWNLAIQRQLPSHVTLEIAYAGSKGVHLQVLTDQNQVRVPGPGDVQERRPYPTFGPFTSIQMRGNSSYHSLQLKAEKRLSHGLSFLSAFTFSRGLDDAPPICCASPWPGNSYNLRANKGLADYHQKDRWVTSFDYLLPFGKGAAFLNQGKALDLIVGGWHATGIFTVTTGFPFTPTMGYDSSNTGTQGYTLPDRIANGNLPAGQRSIDEWFDINAFTDAADFKFGNSGYNVLIAPGFVNLDASLRKVFNLTERHKIEFRFEGYNFLNHPNFGQPDSNIDDGPGGAGAITSLSGTNRQIQLGLKYMF